MSLLLREAIGDRLRRTRAAQHRTLREVSRTARVSLGYLSEVERGQKEASSELLAAICHALDLPLADLLHGVAGDIRPDTAPDTGLDRELRRELDRELDRELGAGIEGGRLVPMPSGQAQRPVAASPVATAAIPTATLPNATLSTTIAAPRQKRGLRAVVAA